MIDHLKTSFNTSRTMKIAICGKMCSGKSTLANTLKVMDSRYTIYSIGQAVKDIGTDLFGMKEKDRNLLIQIGAKMREIDPDVWTKHIVEKTKNETHCIIDDMRYQNEYDILKDNGFVFVQLHVSRHIQEQRIKKIYMKNYQGHLDNIDHLSEKNEFTWHPDKLPVMEINSEEDRQIVNQRIHSFLQKNENNQ